MGLSTRKAGGRPTRERAAQLDDLLLDGARSTFCRKGVAATSVDEIALELGISKHTIYRRYPNKGALLEAVVERDIRRFKAALTSAAMGVADPLEAVRQTALRYFEIGSSRDYAAFYLSVSAEAAFSPALRHRLAAWSRMALESLVGAIASAQAAGLVLPGDPGVICEILVDLLEGANNRVRLRADETNNTAEPDRIFQARWMIFLRACGRVDGPPFTIPSQ
ncbi:TetR/AcrR family transcriptional regulator [Sphingomonas fennica]|uniref:TetR family transcriptional regulator n=1 Tax=Edaphosphingomonas fennica TaxID=114404 RepID=A0A2T4I6S8_9SPHN|nr:TetR/AcrR family transcriptional regulator [Sphingomonas fennica]PTD26312.1 TetR family transcriptional regulator [Sphingomonas fennica]